MNDNMDSVNDEDLLESFKVYALTQYKTVAHYQNNPEPLLSPRAEVAFALQEARKEILYLHKMLRRQTASGVCVIGYIDDALVWLEKV